ncbi:hypothetical protein EV421DRAFT_1914167 [Armillaria borealis]|uniref:Uncharacterized protein n=1 Tax=Armillaria borealis TaxID=47425 RepID=A0AA39MD07_9AGAR|nr:hypothetical protein EV421DRAFT_1914167 [Armillaria borealis]
MKAILSTPSPEIIDGLLHNLPPSDAIRSTVLAKIQECQHFIAMVNRFGHRLVVKDHLFLSMEKAKAEKLLVHLKSILHPVCCVPDDILLELFTLVIDFTGASAVSTDMWRALILVTPSLWSDVHLNFNNNIYLRYHLSHAECILIGCLKRSESHLLNVFVHGPHAHPDTNRVLSHLLTSVARWRSLTVDAGPEVYKMFEKCSRESLTELRILSMADSVYMDVDPKEEDRYTGVILKAFCFTPKLCQLFLSPLLLSSLSLSAETMYNNIQEFSVNLFD